MFGSALMTAKSGESRWYEQRVITTSIRNQPWSHLKLWPIFKKKKKNHCNLFLLQSKNLKKKRTATPPSGAGKP